VPPSVAAACAPAAPPQAVPSAEEVAAVEPVVLDAEAVALAPPTALDSADDVPGPAVLASPTLVPRPPGPNDNELEPALVLLDELCEAAAEPTLVPLDVAAEDPPFAVLAELSLPFVPDSLSELALEPPAFACEEAEWPPDDALDSAFEPLPTEPAPAPSPPALGPDLPTPAAAVFESPPYALAPAPVVPSPSLTPATAGAPPELRPYAPPMPIAPWPVPPPVLLWPATLPLSLPYALDRAPPSAVVGSASEVPVR
jgi:hypothetical protein